MADPTKIITSSKEKSQDKCLAAERAINDLLSNNNKITFYSVAKQAGTATQFLYKNKELREMIMKYRN